MSIPAALHAGDRRLIIKRKWLVAVVAAAVSIVGAGCERGKPATTAVPGALKRVLVFGIDGGTWDVMRPMIEAGELPNLAKLYGSGIHGTLQSRNPALSPVVWSTIFTGRLPQDHGVVDWKTSQSQHRKVKALWEITSQQDVLTDVFNVPSTFPPTQIDGVMISGFPLGGSTTGGNTGVVASLEGLDDKAVGVHYQYNAEILRDAMRPLAVGSWSPWFDVQVRGRPSWRSTMRVKRLDRDKYYLSPIYRTDSQLVYTHPADLLVRLTGVLGERPYIPEGPGWSKYAEPETPEYLFEHLLQVSEIQSDATAAFAADDWRLFIYVNTLVDRVCHPYWAYANPQDYIDLPEKNAERYGYAVKQAYRETDKQLGALLARVKEPTYVVLASDHGFHSNPDRRQYIGTHDLAGIYLVSGPGIPGRRGEQANIEDITPTVLYLLDLPVAADMTGKVIREVREVLNRRERRVESYESTAPARGSEQPVDKETWEQLKGLGYVDDKTD
jgi:hypothetical protein